MSMSTHVVGFKPADETWNKMKEAWEACESAGVSIPDKVLDYFDGESPEDKPGMEVDIYQATEDYSADMIDGYQIDVDKLPEGVKFIRVYNSY